MLPFLSTIAIHYPKSMALGNDIRRVRTVRGWSLRELAASLGMDHSYLARIEDGSRLPGEGFLPAVADFLGISTENLIQTISREKAEILRGRVRGQRSFLPLSEIEVAAGSDRERFLQLVERDYFDWPEDRNRIPRNLCKLSVIYENATLHSADALIYAGLFAGDYDYRGEKNVIVVSRSQARRSGTVSEKTQTFHVLHELGHFRFHLNVSGGPQRSPDEPRFCSSGDRSSIEFQANAYASSFLMPRQEIETAISGRKVVDSNDERRLCGAFYVEPWMLRFRLKAIGIRLAPSGRGAAGARRW